MIKSLIKIHGKFSTAQIISMSILVAVFAVVTKGNVSLFLASGFWLMYLWASYSVCNSLGNLDGIVAKASAQAVAGKRK